VFEVRSSWFADADGDGALAVDDCDEGDASVFPGAPEGCDGLDTDCDGAVPDGEVDDDGDGLPECAGDCDDDDPTRSPLGVETACDGVDEDCDGQIDEGFDADADGTTACGGDCDDVDPRRAPTHDEVPFNGLDEDCDGQDDTSIPAGCSCAASGTERPATAWGCAGLLVGLFRRRRQRGTDESFDAL
jgi:MYXO-CTERM domain-containing protein